MRRRGGEGVDDVDMETPLENDLSVQMAIEGPTRDENNTKNFEHITH